MSNKENGWAYKPLSDLIVLALGGDWGKAEDFEDPDYTTVHCLRGAEFKNWKVEKGASAAKRKIKNSSLEKRRLIEGDLLVEISGGGPDQPVGRTVLIDKEVLNHRPDLPKVSTNFLRLIRPSGDINPKFLDLYLKYFYFTGEVVKYQAGSNNLRNLKFKEYITIPIPVPLLSEQQRIVAKIEELFSELDAGVVSLNKAKEQLKIYRQAVLKAAFEGKLTGNTSKNLPSNWKELTIGDFAVSMKNGIYKPKSFYNENGTACLRMYNIQDGQIRWYDIKRMSLSDGEIEEYQLLPGDILVNRVNSRELVGKSAIIRKGLEQCVYESKNIRLRLENIDPEYVNYWLLFNATRYFNMNAQQVVGMASINQGQISKMPIPVAPETQQKSVVQEIESRMSLCDNIEQTIEQELKQSEALRQSILKKAFEGKLN